MKRVLAFLRPQTGRTALQVGIKFGSTLLELFLPWILEHIIDDIAPTGDRHQLLLWGVLMFLCALAVFFSAAAANRMATKIAATFTRALRHSLFCKVTVLSSEQVDRFTVPSLISRRSMSPVEMWAMPKYSHIFSAWVPLPAPGGPKNTSFMDVYPFSINRGSPCNDA